MQVATNIYIVIFSDPNLKQIVIILLQHMEMFPTKRKNDDGDLLIQSDEGQKTRGAAQLDFV